MQNKTEQMLEISKIQKEQLRVFKKSLIQKNKQINLFSRKESGFIENLFEENIYSSSLLQTVLQNKKEEVLDVGSGGGLPGFICGILYPETQFFLCEQNRKKAECLKSFIFDTSCKNIKVLPIKAEDIGRKFPIILSQATTNLRALFKLFEQILSPEGCAYLWKNSLESEGWADSPLKSTVFKSYELSGHKKLILKAQFKT